MLHQIEVSQSHIDRANAQRPGIPEWSELARICPVAQALRDQFPEADVFVDHDHIDVTDRNDEPLFFARVTRVMERFIERWDDEKPVEPHRFLVRPERG